MDIYKKKKQQLKDFFDSTALTRIKYRKRKSYYWDSITDYCNFFIDGTANVLEIGCGTGELIANINGHTKTGIDFSELMIEEAKKQFPSVNFICMSAEDLSLDKKFDVIILSNLIGYLLDIQQVFKALHKVCHD